MKIIISESQLSLIKEALGVPNYILDAAEMLYDVVEKDIKSIDSIEDEYEFDGDIEFELGDKHKVMIDSYELKVKIEEIEDQEGVLDIISMGMGGSFGFNRDVYMKETEPKECERLENYFFNKHNIKADFIFIDGSHEKVFAVPKGTTKQNSSICFRQVQSPDYGT